MESNRVSTILLSCALASFIAAPALGQALNYTSVEAIAGKPVQLTYHADAHKSTCTSAPMPTFRVIEPPKNGVLSVRKAVLSTDKVPGCPGLEDACPRRVLPRHGGIQRFRPCQLCGHERRRPDPGYMTSPSPSSRRREEARQRRQSRRQETRCEGGAAASRSRQGNAGNCRRDQVTRNNLFPLNPHRKRVLPQVAHRAR